MRLSRRDNLKISTVNDVLEGAPVTSLTTIAHHQTQIVNVVDQLHNEFRGIVNQRINVCQKIAMGSITSNPVKI